MTLPSSVQNGNVSQQDGNGRNIKRRNNDRNQNSDSAVHVHNRNVKKAGDKDSSMNTNHNRGRSSNYDRYSYPREHGFERNPQSGYFSRTNDNERHRNNFNNDIQDRGHHHRFHNHREDHFDRHMSRAFPADGSKDLPPRFKKITSHPFGSPMAFCSSPTTVKDVEVRKLVVSTFYLRLEKAQINLTL